MSSWLGGLVLLGALPILAGCEAPRKLVSFPPGTVPVAYEPATAYSACLVAGVTMAANYVENQRRFTVPQVIEDIKAAGGDETRVSDLKNYMAGKGLHVSSLSGRMEGVGPESLAFWLRELRHPYPVVCIINRLGKSADFNHAVVVIGPTGKSGAGTADMVYYLDPSADQPLFEVPAGQFEAMWGRCRHAMLVVMRPPVEEQPGRPDEESVEVQP